MEPSNSPERTEDAGSSPQSYTSLRFTPIERPVTPPASLAKDKDSTPDKTGIEQARGPVPNEAAESPVDKPRVSPPANSSASQPGPRPRRPLPNSPIRRRDSRPWNSPIRRRGASANQRNDRSSNERQNTRVYQRILPRPGDLSRQTVPPINKKPTFFLVFPNCSITSPDGQNSDITPRYFPFHTINVPTPPTVRDGPKGTLQLIMRTSPYEPDFTPDWRVNASWKDNVERVLGREVRDNWPNMMALILEAKASFLEQGSPLIQRRWNPVEIEIAARLKAWRMPDFVVGYLIGSPPPGLGITNVEQFGMWTFDEMNRIDGVHGMGGFGNSEGKEEVADGSDQVDEERKEKTDKEEEAVQQSAWACLAKLFRTIAI